MAARADQSSGEGASGSSSSSSLFDGMISGASLSGLTHVRYSKPTKPPYPAQFDAINGVAYQRHISCGHNPYIEAFKADGVAVDENTGLLVWDEERDKQARAEFRARTRGPINR